MRGKGLLQIFISEPLGITPAYAGKSPPWQWLLWCWQDHPRVCGEKWVTLTPVFLVAGSPPPRVCGEKAFFSGDFDESKGSPPRMRGKEFAGVIIEPFTGITPACAGKRQALAKALSRSRDHPRMCGEKESARPARPAAWGSPPRMRGKVKSLGFRCLLNGITPAYAGKRLKRSRSTVSPVAIVPLFPSVCNKPVVSDGRARCSTFSAS